MAANVAAICSTNDQAKPATACRTVRLGAPGPADRMAVTREEGG